MSEKVTKDQINSVLWQAADTFRGKVDSSTYKDYILTMLFIKYLSDAYKEHLEEYTKAL
ncbi:type I restriction-modification system subunit M N-terminal domain-containing protein [Heyndrickxia sporothermodurans]